MSSADASCATCTRDGTAARVGSFVARRPRRVVLLSAGFLAAFAVAATGVKMNYGQTVANTTKSAQIETQIARVRPKGVIDPQHIYISSSRPLGPTALNAMRPRLARVPHVAQVTQPRFAPGAHAAEIDVALNIDSTTNAALKLAGNNGPLRNDAHGATPRRWR